MIVVIINIHIVTNINIIIDVISSGRGRGQSFGDVQAAKLFSLHAKQPKQALSCFTRNTPLSGPQPLIHTLFIREFPMLAQTGLAK